MLAETIIFGFATSAVASKAFSRRLISTCSIRYESISSKRFGSFKSKTVGSKCRRDYKNAVEGIFDLGDNCHCYRRADNLVCDAAMVDGFYLSYGYRMENSVYAGVGTILIALLPVSFQAIKAAIANPVDSLRDE